MKTEKPISPLKEKSYQFAIKIVHLSQSLISVEREYVLSKQIIHSGTSIGALVRESEFAASRADFINKLTVALKEANEAEYWLMILFDTNFLTEIYFKELLANCKELIAMLVSSIKTAKNLG